MTTKPYEFPLEMVKLVLCDLPLCDDDFMLNHIFCINVASIIIFCFSIYFLFFFIYIYIYML